MAKFHVDGSSEPLRERQESLGWPRPVESLLYQMEVALEVDFRRSQTHKRAKNSSVGSKIGLKKPMAFNEHRRATPHQSNDKNDDSGHANNFGFTRQRLLFWFGIFGVRITTRHLVRY
eukprot:GABV01013322.1.p1 GENE.GABV01013322.1~~GABV01013322.1.p1  ORF type:complete len:118 (-),score=14.80 GABV01013322.1:11-364(-)